LIGDDLPNHTTVYNADATNYEMRDGSDEVVVTLVATGAKTAGVTKKLVFHRGSYVVDESYQMSNRSAAPK
jgi:YidC/Oxa1 family membrane protein insertase